MKHVYVLHAEHKVVPGVIVIVFALRKDALAKKRELLAEDPEGCVYIEITKHEIK